MPEKVQELEEIKYVNNRGDLIALFPGERGMELGVWYGDFSSVILRRSQVKELWLIDCWMPYPNADIRDTAVFQKNTDDAAYLYVVSRFAGNPRVKVVRGMIEEILPLFGDETFDWVYIDAGHRYEMVMRHLELSYKIVKKGGFISGHDYANIGNSPWLKEVKVAVDDFCEKYRLKISYLSKEEFSSFAIMKK